MKNPLTDTDKELIALAGKAGAEAAMNEDKQRTPTHGTPSPSVADLEKRGHYFDCYNDPGAPGCTLGNKIKTISEEITNMKTEQTKFMAVIGFWKWALPVIVAAVGVSAALAGLTMGHKAQAAPSAEIQALRAEIRQALPRLLP